MNLVGKKHIIEWKIYFLTCRCSTDESGVIVELFSRRLFIKILFCCTTILISRFRITKYFSEILLKFFKILIKISRKFPAYLPTPPHPSPISPTPTHPPHPWTHLELQTWFSRQFVFSQIYRVFPTPFIYIIYVGSDLRMYKIYHIHIYIIHTPNIQNTNERCGKKTCHWTKNDFSRKSSLKF